MTRTCPPCDGMCTQGRICPADPVPQRPPLVKGDRGAILFAGALLVTFWAAVALVLRSCA